jgi:hypothetical protein
MPAPIQNFAGLAFTPWGAGWPPDTVGDVGPNHYVQAVNTSIGIFSKTGTQLAAFTFDTLWGGTATPCDDDNQGDPTVIYDRLANRFIVADFAWGPTGLQNGPYYECIAVSQTADPVSGGWFLYAIRADDTTHPWLPDYPKMGHWPDGLYMTANMFDCLTPNCSSATYRGVRVWAFDRTDLVAGAPVDQVIVDISASGCATNVDPCYASLLPSTMTATAPPAGARTCSSPRTYSSTTTRSGSSAPSTVSAAPSRAPQTSRRRHTRSSSRSFPPPGTASTACPTA